MAGEKRAVVAKESDRPALPKHDRLEFPFELLKVERGEKKLGNKGFVDKAPPEVVDEEREKLDGYRRELESLGG